MIHSEGYPQRTRWKIDTSSSGEKDLAHECLLLYYIRSYIIFHYITLHYMTLHYTTLHYITSYHIQYNVKQNISSPCLDVLRWLTWGPQPLWQAAGGWWRTSHRDLLVGEAEFQLA